jgi:branched-subunit amino acid transport protein
MTAVWLTVIVVGIATAGLKGAGSLILGGREPSQRFGQLIAYLAPTLLAALIATQIFTSRQTLVVDARVFGLAVGAVALMLRVPTLLAVAIAAVATALLRALT